MTGQQLLLDLAAEQRMGRADFLPAPSNAEALAKLSDWRDWPQGRLLFCGPKGSGRSHLLRIFQQEARAVFLSGPALMLDDLTRAANAPALVVDDADLAAGNPASEETLFHLVNIAQSGGLTLALAARDVPGTWGLALADLESRLLTCPTIRLHQPDDNLLYMVLHKLCDERQLAVGDDTIAYLIARMGRSFDTARAVVDALDFEAVTRGKRVTRALAAEVLTALEPESTPRP